MKLGFVLFDYFPYGGLQRNCVAIAQECRLRGHEVTIVTRSWQGPKPNDIPVVLLGKRGWTNLSRNRYFLRDLQACLPQMKLDGFVGFNKIPGMDVCYIADPCFREKANRLKPHWFRWTPRYRHFESLERAVFQAGKPTHLLLLSETEQAHYQRYYGTEPRRLHLLPPGIAKREYTEETQAATQARIRASFGWAKEEAIMLFVGSGFRTKGLDRAIRGLASLPTSLRERSRLVVIGRQGPGYFRLLSRALGVADRVSFLGGRDDVVDFLLSADLLVHPAYSENTGTVLLEALTAGLPVMTTDVCGFAPHIQRADAGLVIQSPFHQEEFNSKLREALLSDRHAQWRRNALTYAGDHDLYSRHSKAAELIERIMQPPAGSTA